MSLEERLTQLEEQVKKLENTTNLRLLLVTLGALAAVLLAGLALVF
jgi:hypothetical protein